mgnify:CR=1 FL=1
MKVIIQEMKKVVRPLHVALCLTVLLLLSLGVPKNYIQAKQLLDTEEYPDKFTLYDDYSVDILFHDFLIEEYGNQLTVDDLNEMIYQRAELLEQIDTAARNDEVLLRTGTLFNKESAEFYSVVEPMGNTESAISDQDQIYQWSCINGQMQLDGTDYPIGFLKKMDNVISTLQSGETYQVLPSDIFLVMRKNIDTFIGFVVASWILVIPYGVAETKSGTQMLAVSTRQGRKGYVKKMAAASLICVLLVGAGVIITTLLFSTQGADRYYESHVVSALQSMNLSIAADSQMKLIELYVLLLGMTAVVGVSSALIITNISLQFRHAVSAIACSLPVMLAFAVWYIVYTKIALDFGSSVISVNGGVIWVCIMVLIACVFSAGFILWKYKKNY